jgi:hypothetical protein
MVMIPSTAYPDGEFFDEGMAEVQGAFEEAVQLKRFTGTTGGDEVDGVAPTKDYTLVSTTALIESLSAQEAAASGGFLIIGDLKAQFRLQVYGSESGPIDEVNGDDQDAGRYSDVVVFRGRDYKIVGHPERIHYGGQYYWSVTLRQQKT